MIEEFKSRLAIHTDFFSSLACFDPESPKFMDEDAVSVLASHYPILFDDNAIDDLKKQTSTAKRFFNKSNDKPKTVHDIVRALNALAAAFDEILKLLMVIITLPISSAASERFFSTLKRVKTYVHLTMNNDQLSNLMVISVESEFVKKLDVDLLVDKFGRIGNRRYPVLL